MIHLHFSNFDLYKYCFNILHSIVLVLGYDSSFDFLFMVNDGFSLILTTNFFNMRKSVFFFCNYVKPK